MPVPSSPAVVLIALAVGCVPTTSRQGVGGYCHRDDQCLEGLRCVERACRAAGPVASDAGLLEAGAVPDDAGGGVDSGPPAADASVDAGPADAGQDAGGPDAGEPDAGELPDAGAPDAGQDDAGQDDAGEDDAGEDDAGQDDAARGG